MPGRYKANIDGDKKLQTTIGKNIQGTDIKPKGQGWICFFPNLS
jgi:hypothetical protein